MIDMTVESGIDLVTGYPPISWRGLFYIMLKRLELNSTCTEIKNAYYFNSIGCIGVNSMVQHVGFSH